MTRTPSCRALALNFSTERMRMLMRPGACRGRRERSDFVLFAKESRGR